MNKAMANAFEALMAAIYLDSNVDECDRFVFYYRDYAFIK
jgi:dsRNA-specific ribonuclease